MRRRPFVVLASVLAMGSVVAACTGSGSDAAPRPVETTTSTTTSTTTTTTTTIPPAVDADISARDPFEPV